MATAQVQPSRPRAAQVATLKRRPDFLRLRRGARFATPGFVLEGKRRGGEDEGPSADGARFGFTVSKQVGTAVARNRIKRRLKAAVRDVVYEHARSDFDYVLIARRAALDAGFAMLVSDLIKALGRVNARPADGRPGRPAQSRMRGS
ncbi:MAG: ribonuclease P protein component [Hyphomonadaceae bacterium]|nr:ribonuclease P protein component [Hyphomonadaceae bacterium]